MIDNFTKHLRWHDVPKKPLRVSFKGDTLLVIERETLKKFLTDMLDPNSEIISEADKKVQQFIRYYFSCRAAFYKRNFRVNSVPKSSKDYSHFKRALEIYETHGVTERTFMLSQIDGLKYLNGGNGIFPKPSQLSSIQAEERLLSYITTQNQKVVVTTYDTETPYKENKKFMRFYQAIRNGDTDSYKLIDALYVKAVIESKNADVPSWLAEAIQELVNIKD